MLFRNTQSDTADGLANELITARQAYIARRNSVIDRVGARRAAVAESISDLQSEDAALASVEASAKNDVQ